MFKQIVRKNSDGTTSILSLPLNDPRELARVLRDKRNEFAPPGSTIEVEEVSDAEAQRILKVEDDFLKE